MRARISRMNPKDKVRYEPTKFQNMPKPVSWNEATTNSWEDIYGIFIDRNIDPTKEQIVKAFELSNERADRENAYGMEGYWTILGEAVDEVEDE